MTDWTICEEMNSASLPNPYMRDVSQSILISRGVPPGYMRNQFAGLISEQGSIGAGHCQAVIDVGRNIVMRQRDEMEIGTDALSK